MTDQLLVRTNDDPKIKMMQKNYQPTLRVYFECNEETRTEQSHAKSCDINNIMSKVSKTGLLNHVNTMKGDYSDLGEAQDYHESLNIIRNAENSFNSLPSSIRTQFENDPQQFLEFVHDEDNHDQMVELGLKKRTPMETEPAEPGSQEKQPKATASTKDDSSSPPEE